MNARFSIPVMIGVVASALFLGGSLEAREAPKPKAEPPLSARIVGQWTSEPFEASVGKATQTFCFRADGTVAVHTETESGPLSNSGTYALVGDRVTVKLANPASSVVLRVSFSGERLVLTDESAQARSYGRGANGC
jgi:uncharacterized protein (TIGR03066 family)